MPAFAVGVVAAAASLLAMSYTAMALGVPAADGASIHVIWLIIGNVASLAGAGAAAIHGSRGIAPAVLVWAVTTALFMYVLQAPGEAPATTVAWNSPDDAVRVTGPPG